MFRTEHILRNFLDSTKDKGVGGLGREVPQRGPGELAESVPIGDYNNEQQSKTAAETGNTYISETMRGTVNILTTNLRFKTMHGWKIMLECEYTTIATDNQKYRYDPQTGNNYISGTLSDSVESPTANSGFSMMTSSIRD